MIRIFLDANVYFAASRSPQGGSSEILKIIISKGWKVFATKEILKEAERNIRLKEGLAERIRFYKIISDIKPTIIKVNKFMAEKRFSRSVSKKDIHVLEGTRKSKAKFLVSLDKKHILSLKEKIKWTRILTPGEFIQEVAKT